MIELIKRWAGCLAGLFWAWCLSAQPNLSRVEYYIDIDPGYGKATAISFTPGNSLTNIALNINPASLTSGVHILGIRARDANGGWSLDNKWLFAKPYPADSTSPVPNLKQVEYYIDKDPGYGKATAISFTPGTSLSNIGININPASLTSGVHIFGIRAQNTNGGWSLDNKWLFAKPYPADSTSPIPNLKLVEYYIDKDPGFGKGIPVAIDAVTNLPNFKLPINIAGLSHGSHNLFIRSKNINGGWSLDNEFSFTVSSTIAAPAIIVNSVSNKAPCNKDTLTVSYQADATYNAGNIFRTDLIDANGSFATPIVILFYT